MHMLRDDCERVIPASCIQKNRLAFTPRFAASVSCHVLYMDFWTLRLPSKLDSSDNRFNYQK